MILGCYVLAADIAETWRLWQTRGVNPFTTQGITLKCE